VMTSSLSLPAPLEEGSPPSARERYTLGCDLGQSHDPTAIAAVRRVDDDTYDPLRAMFQVGHLERLPLGTPYPGVVRHVSRMLGSPSLRGRSELVIDFTGVGRPVFDMFEVVGVSPIGVTITAGDSVTREGAIYRVPKLVLISRVQAMLHAGRLKIHKALLDAPALVAELQDFRAEVTDSGYWKFGARAGKHDDLVLAVAIALWRAHGDNVAGWGLMEYTRQQADLARLRTAAPSTPTPPDVVLRAPAGVSEVHAMSGRRYTVDARGYVRVRAADAEPLIRAGMPRVETETAN
jgi:hypothetical protein